MKRSSGIIVTGLSAALLSTGWVAGSGMFTADQTAQAASAEATTGTSTGSASAASPSASADAAADAGAASSPSVDASSDASASGSGASAASSTDASTDAATTTGVTGTFDGASISSRYGFFQAEITVEDGTITAIDWLQDGESDRHSQQINAQAMPVLEQAILEAQSVDVGYVSGASFTSEAVEEAVYSAMQEAGIA